MWSHRSRSQLRCFVPDGTGKTMDILSVCALCGLCALRVKSFGLDKRKAQHRVHRDEDHRVHGENLQPCIDKWEGRVANCARFPFSISVYQGGLHASLEALRLK